jgi:hypothetical protein
MNGRVLAGCYIYTESCIARFYPTLSFRERICGKIGLLGHYTGGRRRNPAAATADGQTTNALGKESSNEP